MPILVLVALAALAVGGRAGFVAAYRRGSRGAALALGAALVPLAAVWGWERYVAATCVAEACMEGILPGVLLMGLAVPLAVATGAGTGAGLLARRRDGR